MLVGGARGRDIWYRWLALTCKIGTLLEAEPDGAIDAQIRAAVARAVGDPAHPIAVLAPGEAAARWRAGRSDRLAAMVDEGWTIVPEPDATDGARPAPRSARDGLAAAGSGPRDVEAVPGQARYEFDARSLAEVTLFEALEATPATAGRFRLNESLSVRFGPAAAEIDLLSRGDRIAIEIDGVHHFADPDRYRRDRRKDLLLQTQGFVVVRLLAEDVVRDVRGAVTVVSQALAYRLGERRP